MATSWSASRFLFWKLVDGIDGGFAVGVDLELFYVNLGGDLDDPDYGLDLRDSAGLLFAPHPLWHVELVPIIPPEVCGRQKWG